MTTNKMCSVRTIILPAVSRKDLYYASGNAGICFYQIPPSPPSAIPIRVRRRHPRLPSTAMNRTNPPNRSKRSNRTARTARTGRTGTARTGMHLEPLWTETNRGHPALSRAQDPIVRSTFTVKVMCGRSKRVEVGVEGKKLVLFLIPPLP